MTFHPPRSSLFQHKPFFVLPFRLGAIIVLGITALLSAAFSVLLWYGYASSSNRTPQMGFFLAILQDILVLISAFGFVAIFKSKRPLITAYAYSVLVHLVANAIIIGYFLSSSATDDQCSHGPSTPQTPCNIPKIPKPVYFAIAIVVLVIESYNGFVITAYLYHLRTEEKDEDGRDSLLRSWNKESSSQDRERRFSDTPSGRILPQQHKALELSAALTRHLDIEAAEGYGGGLLTHSDITREEKARLRQMEESGGNSRMYVDNQPPVVRREAVDEDLPSYNAASA